MNRLATVLNRRVALATVFAVPCVAAILALIPSARAGTDSPAVTDRSVFVPNGAVRYAEESIDQARAFAAAHPETLARYGALAPGHTADYPASKAMAEGRYADAARILSSAGGTSSNGGGPALGTGSDDNGGANVGGTTENESGTGTGLDDPNPAPEFNGPYISFQGPNTCGCEPPDPTLTVGTNHVLMGINDVIRAANKTTGVTAWSVTWEAFFASVNPAGAGAFTSDPKMFFDPYSQRYFCSILYINSAGNKSWWMLAVSTTDNITDSTTTWRKWAFDPTVADANTFADYPGFGYDNDAIYITSNMFNTSGTSFLGVDMAVIPKAQLLVATPTPTFTQINRITTSAGSSAFTLQPCTMYGASPPNCYLASASSGSGSSLFVYRVNNPLGSPTLSKTSVAVTSYSTPPGAAQLGTATTIRTNDTRLINATWRNNSLWCAHETNSSSLCSARWYQVNTTAWPSASLTQSGTYNSGSSHYYFPSVAVDAAGNMAMGFSRSNSSERPSAWHTSRLATDPPGTLAAPTLDKAGTAAYTGTRWGDYSGTAIDPVDNSTFWVLQEYSTGSSTWSTWATSFTLCVSPTVSAISDANATCGVAFNSGAPSTSAGTGPFTWSLGAGAPAGMTINPSTGVVSWANPVTTGSPFAITTTATNSCGSNSQNWNLIVAANPPSINPITNTFATCGTPYASSAPTATGGIAPFTWALLSGPAGMTIDTSTGAVSWPNPTAIGSPFAISVQATSSGGCGASAPQNWQLGVVVGDFDQNGLVTDADIPGFVTSLLSGNPACAGDLNGDTFLDGLDIQAFDTALGL